MSANTIPTVGELHEYSVIVSKADFWHRRGDEKGHMFLGFKPGVGFPRECDPDNTRSCHLCYDQWEVRTSPVVSVVPYMDNSIEVRLEDGTRHNVVQPHGDVCY